MKALLTLAALALISSSSVYAAAPLPHCWTTNGRSIGFNPRGEEIADGQWLIQVQFAKISKRDLAILMEKTKRGNLDQVGQPIVFEPDFMILVVGARNDAGKAPRLPRSELQRRVAAQLHEIIAHPAIPSVDCNGIAHPADVR